MKKYNLGCLQVLDKELFDTKEEIVGELLDRMQKYVVESDTIVKNPALSLEEKVHGVERLMNYFCSLDEFMRITLGITVGDEDGMEYTQTMFNRMYYHELMLKAEQERVSEKGGSL